MPAACAFEPSCVFIMSDVHEIYGYEIVETLGHGARSTVYAVLDRKRKKYALKRVVKSSTSDQRFIDQAVREHEVASKFNSQLLRRSFKLIRHRNFIRTSEVLVVMEMVKGHSLEERCPDDITLLCAVCRQAASGLAIMHEGGYVHADIKPNNIMINESLEVKLIDFGQSCPTGTVKERIQGTPDYIAPEQVKRRAITPVTDIYNLGATMYWLLTKQHVPSVMPKSQSQTELTRISSEDRKKCIPPVEINASVPPALNSLVMDCVERHPKRRPQSIEEVAKRLDIAASQIKRRL